MPPAAFPSPLTFPMHNPQVEKPNEIPLPPPGVKCFNYSFDCAGFFSGVCTWPAFARLFSPLSICRSFDGSRDLPRALTSLLPSSPTFFWFDATTTFDSFVQLTPVPESNFTFQSSDTALPRFPSFCYDFPDNAHFPCKIQ